MGLIESDIIRINFIVEQYQEKTVRTSLEKSLETILDILKNAIDNLASSYQLARETALKDIKFYSFTSRIKKGESLKEKLIRNNLVNNFRSILPDDFDKGTPILKNKVRKKIKEIDDIIGLRILTDLSIDCFNMLRLLKSNEFRNKVAEDGLFLNEHDLAKQPQKMKNGLEIFKIKGVYDESVPFELQIKSKIIAAWGDMEHSIFYKDYTTSPIKDTNQVAMNHVGKLLFQVDDFLFSIRDANKVYNEKAEVINFFQEFKTEYRTRISAHLLGIDYDFSKIIEILYWLKFSKNIKIKKVKDEPLRTSHLSLSHVQYAKYILLRNSFYDLKLLEAISLSWILSSDTVIDETNIHLHLKNYLECLVIAQTKMLLNKRIIKDEENETIDAIRNLLQLAFDYNCDCKFVFDINLIASFFRIKLLIKDICITEHNIKEIEIIQDVLYLIIFNGDASSYVKTIKKEKELIMILNSLSSNLVFFKESNVDDAERLIKKIDECINNYS